MKLTGKGASPGSAVGRVFISNEKFPPPADIKIDPGEEQSNLEKYKSVKEKAIKEIYKLKTSMEKTDPAKAKIFDAHIEIADDIIINEEIPSKILKERRSGDFAIYSVYENVINILKNAGDSLIAERASDFDDVRTMLLRQWYENKNDDFSGMNEPCIIACDDLKPSDIAAFDKSKVLAILTQTGGSTSHAAIIAKSYGIPAVFGIKDLLNSVKQGQNAAVDADKGIVILDPPDNVLTDYKVKSEAFRLKKARAEGFKYKECRALCGERIDIGLNIAGVDEKDLEASEYTDSVGVFRTEFIYMGKNELPSEDEQFNVYRKLLECYNPRPVILRTLDIGGDKKLTSMPLPAEDNPFLGNRALRFCFSNPDIFRTQIRACLRASVYGNLWIMLPMIASLDDIREAKDFINKTKVELDNENVSYNEVKIGVMIEIPSIAVIADLAVKEVDFASIGSNDLCQYLCAADRMNVEVEKYYQSYHPAMFRLIKNVIEVFNTADKPVSFCGELGSDPAAIPVLIGLGLRKLSMGSSSVAAAKSVIAGITIEDAKAAAAAVLKMNTAGEIENYLVEVLAKAREPYRLQESYRL
ncbi:MAG: phosphoenolpyruvate--protein phosphotransferase [Treponema sp.]|nr:phosphoenolpyruvate--protein phosphotransferase [Treponema sp.]